MNVKAIFIFLFIAVIGNPFANAQTLFTYGGKKADAKEFLRAFQKNNPDKSANKAKAISEYLSQYIRSRLKTAEAYERGYDTLHNIRMEIAALRSQIVDNYMTDPQLKEKLGKEAFERSQKDIRFAHIFISFSNAALVIDTAGASKKKEEVLQRLKKGEDFMVVAQQLSDDPAAKTNKGDGGYITVFTLPYEFETAIYNTPTGKYSSVVRSKGGYHIFKKIGERKAVGKIKAQQILLALPPGADEAAKKELSKRADSLYTVLTKGGNFGALASAFSNDYISASNSGTMPDISVGQYDAAFENQLWGLKKDGDFSKPFLTEHGWHIVRRESIKPIPTNSKDKNYQQELNDKIIADGRWKTAKDFIYNAISSQGLYQKVLKNDGALWALSDSLLDRKPLAEMGKQLTVNSTLFNIGKASYNVENWVSYAQSNRFQTEGNGIKTYTTLWNEWVKTSMYSYYRDNLENFNNEFATQMKEFTDGNLFFEIMQQEVWNKAQADTAVLKSIYATDMKKYKWEKSAEAVIFFCADSTTLKEVHSQIKANPSKWKSIAESFGDRVLADSSRYDWTQLPGLGKTIPKDGFITYPVINQNDFTGSFTYIIKSDNQPIQKKYNEALGLVINDYQAQLEKKFDEQLAKKYPVIIDKQVLAAISK
jgi:peptidyl-prolyl cis-trans isomerase SurA